LSAGGRGSFPGYQATAGIPQERAARDVLPGQALARHIDDFLADLANAKQVVRLRRPVTRIEASVTPRDT
jgi:hypothetical protein